MQAVGVLGTKIVFLLYAKEDEQVLSNELASRGAYLIQSVIFSLVEYSSAPGLRSRNGYEGRVGDPLATRVDSVASRNNCRLGAVAFRSRGSKSDDQSCDLSGEMIGRLSMLVARSWHK